MTCGTLSILGECLSMGYAVAAVAAAVVSILFALRTVVAVVRSLLYRLLVRHALFTAVTTTGLGGIEAMLPGSITGVLSEGLAVVTSVL